MNPISMVDERFALKGLSCGQGFNSFLMGEEGLQVAILVRAVSFFNHLLHRCNRVRYISAAAVCPLSVYRKLADVQEQRNRQQLPTKT